MELHRELNDEEVQEFQQWARDNYNARELIPTIWHPVIQAECRKINEIVNTPAPTESSFEIIIKKEISISDENLMDLLVTAFEGGIGYWADWQATYSGKHPADTIINGKSVLIFDMEDPEEMFELTKEKTVNGIRQYMERNDLLYVQDIMNDHDAGDADEIIQLGLFNKIVYG